MSKVRISYRRITASRIAVTGLCLLIQIAWLILSILRLSAYSMWISLFFSLLSFAIVMYIVCKDDNPSYKIVWIILIMLSPILGAPLYLFAGNKKPSKSMHRRISSTKAKYICKLNGGEEVLEMIKNENPRTHSTFSYITRLSGYPVYTNTEAEYFPVGEEMFEAMKREIQKAEHFIFLEYFIINEGKMWNALLKLLVEKAESGVDVRIIYDDMGCVALLPPKYFKKLEALNPNIHVLAFNPVVPVLSLVMNNRDHRKIMVIDGFTGFNGGINLSDEYINEIHPYGHWKDTGVMLRGEAVMNLTEMFLEVWHTFRNNEKDEDLMKYAPSAYGGRASADGYIQPFYDTPLDNEALSENLYIDILNQAEKYVYIFTPYLILDDNMKCALCLAAKRGVDVRIVTPGIPDKKAIFRLTRANYSPLLASGVRIFEYSPGFIHAKSFVCDDKTGVVGTINLDYRSLFLHFECGTLMYNSSAVLKLRDDHIETMKKSREITSDNFRSYYKGTMFDAALRIIAPLL